AATDEGALDRAAGQLRWTILAVEGRRHGAQAIPETASPDLVRRQPSRCVAARRQTWPRLLRCGVVHDETVRRAGADRAAGARRGHAQALVMRCRWISASSLLLLAKKGMAGASNFSLRA